MSDHIRCKETFWEIFSYLNLYCTYLSISKISHFLIYKCNWCQNTFADSSAKLLVVTGFPYENGSHAEVIDLENEDSICQELSNAPYEMDGGTGGFLQNEVLICGGFSDNHPLNKCWMLNQNRTISMKYERRWASSIVINNKVSM